MPAGSSVLLPPDAASRHGGGGSEWVELTKARGDIDAHLLVGRLVEAGIETRTVTDRSSPGAWLLAGSNPWAPVTVLVRRFQLDDARVVLAEISFDLPAATGGPPPPRRRGWSSPLLWWIVALALGAIFTGIGLSQTASSIQCGTGPSCTSDH